MQELDLRLSLLRGASGNPISLSLTGRPSGIAMQIQKKVGLSDQLSVSMMRMIATGRIPPGMRMPSERRMAEALPASRVCVRSALERLKTQGYLEAVQGSGTRVTCQLGLLEGLVQANRQNIEDLAQFCLFFDDLLFQRAMEGDRIEVARALTAARRAGLAPAMVARAECVLRVRLAEISGSRILVRLAASLDRGLHAYFDALTQEPPTPAGVMKFDELERSLLDHVLSGHAANARSAMAARSVMIRDRALSGRPEGSAALAEFCEATLLRDLTLAPPQQLSDLVAQEIASMVAAGEFAGDDQLFSERRFSDLFGVSRATVQEALTRLKAETMIQSSERQRSRTRQEAAGPPPVSTPDLVDINLLRLHLEVWAARRAAENLNDADGRGLRRILAEMSRPIEDRTRDINLDLLLHMTIARIAGNALNLFISEALRSVVLSYFHISLTDPGVMRRAGAMLLDQHDAVVRAIVDRDPVRAEQAMTAHVSGFRDGLRQMSA